MSGPRPELHDLHGFSPKETYDALYDMAQNVPPDQVIVELGSFHAKGAIFLAEGASAGGGAHVYTVDPWDLPGYRTTTGTGRVANRINYADPYHRKYAERQIRESGLSDRITMVQGFSSEVGSSWAGPKVGLLFIDGDHRESYVRQDYAMWERHLARDAVVLFDDYRAAFPGVVNVVTRLVDKGLLTEPLTIGSLAVTTRR